MFLLWALPALAYDITTIGASWPADAFPVPWTLSSDLGDLDPEGAESAIQAGFQVWEDAGCGVSFSYEGQVDDASFGGAFDGQNTVFFLNDGWPEDAALLSTPRIGTSGAELVEVDLALNGQYFGWSLDDADGTSTFDVSASVAHEVGHLLGMWHSTVEGATLNPAMDGNPEARTLSEDDLAGLCALYGETTGDGEFGDVCEEAEDCADDLVCVADGEERYCSSTCATDDECPNGYTCLDVAGSGVCADAAAKTGCGCRTSNAPAGLLSLAMVLLTLCRRR